MKNYRAWVLVVLGGALAAASVSWAAAITLGNTQTLAFGKFVAGSGGTVSIGANGMRSKSGGVVLVPSGVGTAAQFSVTGDPNVTYAISLPGNGVVSLTSGSDSMAVTNFTSSPNLAGTLGAGGSQTLSVGATLNVGSNQATGAYSGAFDVTVNYN